MAEGGRSDGHTQALARHLSLSLPQSWRGMIFPRIPHLALRVFLSPWERIEVAMIIVCRSAVRPLHYSPRRHLGIHRIERRELKRLAIPTDTAQNRGVGLFFRINLSSRKLAALGLSLCLITGCGGNARDIVGAWRTSPDPNAMIWEFSNDGSVLMGPNRGRYTFGDNNRIKIETSTATSVYQIELVGDKMTLKEPSGSKLVLTRVK
jgi:hypothetical protein